MKYSSIDRILMGLTIALGAIATQIQPSYAGNKFFCGYRNNQPATFVRTSRGNVPIISWVDNSFPPPWTPLKRCQVISARFEQFYDNGTLNYIKAGWRDDQPVLCVAAYRGGGCLPNGVLVTLKSRADPNLTLQRLLDRRVLATGRPLDLSSSVPPREAARPTTTGRPLDLSSSVPPREGAPPTTTDGSRENKNRVLLSEVNGESYFDIESFLNESN